MVKTGKPPVEDLRQRRSKQHLSEALLELMSERPFREISVVDVCQRARVHRTTFYAHFEDKNALLRYVLAELRRSFEAEQEGIGGQTGTRGYLLAEFHSALSFLKRNRQVYLSGLKGGSTELWLVEDAVTQWLERRFEAEGFYAGRERMAQSAARYYSGALLSVVRWWLESEMPISEEELVEQVTLLLPSHPGGAEEKNEAAGAL